jgi:uncharacterized protein (DUF58 family)
MESSGGSPRRPDRSEALAQSLKVRPVGLMLLVLSLPGLIRLAGTPSATLAGLSAACLLSVALAGRWCRRQAERVELKRQHPAEVHGQQVFRVQVQLGLTGKRPITGLQLADDFDIGLTPGGASFFVPALVPGETLSCVYRGSCTAGRGWQKLSRVVLTLEDPLGLVSLTLTRRLTSELLVLPEARDLGGAQLRSPAALSDADEERAQEAGAGEEFAGTREWRPGDRYRDIHWRSSARTGDLVVRETVRLVRPELVVLVHLHRPAPWSAPAEGSRGVPGGGPWRLPRLQRDSKRALLSGGAVDLCIEAAASLVRWGAQAGYRTSLALGGLQLEILESVAGTQGVLSALRLLAVAEPQSTTELDGLLGYMLTHIPHGAVVVVITPVAAIQRAEALEALAGLAARRHRVEVVISFPIADRAAGWEDPSEDLARAGLIPLLVSSSDDLGRMLVDSRYVLNDR